MTCTGQMIATGTPVHHACLECGHRAGAHTLHPDGNVSCDTCAILDATAPLVVDLTNAVNIVLDLADEMRHRLPPSEQT